MKAIQITVDERLLARLDADPEAKRSGRSAVFRRAVDEYLRRRRRHLIAESYRAAYGAKPGLGREWEGWDEEGAWPEP